MLGHRGGYIAAGASRGASAEPPGHRAGWLAKEIVVDNGPEFRGKASTNGQTGWA